MPETDLSPPRLVSKQDYAAMRGRSPGAVSHWIKQGKLTAPALVGSGRTAKVDWRLADQQLGELLDLGQQLAQPEPLLRCAGGPDDDTDADLLRPRSGAAARPSAPANEDNARRVKARADREEAEATLALLKLKDQQGQWLPRGDAEAAWQKHQAAVIGQIEADLATAAALVVEAASADPKVITLVLRAWFRTVRQRLAGAARATSSPAGTN